MEKLIQVEKCNKQDKLSVSNHAESSVTNIDKMDSGLYQIALISAFYWQKNVCINGKKIQINKIGEYEIRSIFCRPKVMNKYQQSTPNAI